VFSALVQFARERGIISPGHAESNIRNTSRKPSGVAGMTAKAEAKRRAGPGTGSGFERLESELKRLKRALGLGHELEVEWLPGHTKRFSGKQLSGEVLGDTIYIYDGEEERALSTLRHEFFDYAVCQVIEPYKRIANELISAMNEEAYQKKEKLIERLSRLELPDEDSAGGQR